MVTFAQFGAGRIGKIHARTVTANPAARLTRIVDVDAEAAAALAAATGAEVATEEAVLADATIDAVIIASATDTHAPLIEKAARAGKAIFCEKPVDLDRGRVERCLAVVAEAGVPLFVAFNRRFDPEFDRLRGAMQEGAIGTVEAVLITSLDPAPPPVSYIERSGGLFRDMMIHDFDMARWLLGEEPVEVFARGACNVDPAIAAAGDIDTAMVTLRTASGRLAQIFNSRRSGYGYDQRIEVHGSAGMLQAGNRLEHTVVQSTAAGVTAARPQHFFLERYMDAYRRELDAFIGAVETGAPAEPNGQDGLAALKLADAAERSLKTGSAVEAG